MFNFLVLASFFIAFALGDTLPEQMTKDYPLFSDHSGKIVGGVETTIEIVPWQVSLTYAFTNASGSYRSGVCSGSIISQNWVVTVAHCVFNTDKTKKPTNLVTAGATDSWNGSKHVIAETILHPLYEFVEYTKTSLYDIALIRVVQNFEFDLRRQPVPLYPRAQKTLDGSRVTVSGWGVTRMIGGIERPTNLNRMVVEIIEKSECEKYLSSVYNREIATVGQICGYYNGTRATCNGDSGGPVTKQGVLIGLVSFGSATCGGIRKPSVFTEVARCRYWISEHTGV